MNIRITILNKIKSKWFKIIWIINSIINKSFSYYYQLNHISKKYKNTYTFKTKYGFITINKFDKYFINKYMNNEYWDEEILCHLFDNYIEKGNILEIGAHVGTSTLFYSKQLEPGYKIYAFEPQKKIFNLLYLNISQNNLLQKVEANNQAIFCYNGIVKLSSIDLDGPNKNKQILNLESQSLDINYGGIGIGENGESIKCITFDKLNIKNIKFIHCDAQGAEPYIFSHSKDYIKNNRPVILYENAFLYGDYLLNQKKIKSEIR